MSEGEYKFHGIRGDANVFGFPYCENDRLWRRYLGLLPDRMQKNEDFYFDECHNAWSKPHSPVHLDMLNHLHKRSDYE